MYARFSPRPNPSECESITAQLTRCRAYAEMLEYELIGEFEDAALSGKTMANRLGLEAALKLARQKKAVLIVYSLTRLARSTRDAIDILDTLQGSGADLACIREQFDTATPVGKLVFRIMASIAEFERDQIAERTSDAMQTYQSQGRRMSKQPPYGWEMDPESPPHRRSGLPSRIRPCDSERRAIREIIALRNGGASIRDIARTLESRRVPCRGTNWNKNLVHKILSAADQEGVCGV